MTPRNVRPSTPTHLGTTPLVAEFLGTAGLLSAVTMSRALFDTLLAHGLAVGASLTVLIMVFRSVSGAHLNPLVTAAFGFFEKWPLRHVLSYAAAQIAGGFSGVVLSNAMLNEGIVNAANVPTVPMTFGLSEAIATGGLVSLVCLLARTRTPVIAPAIGSYIAAAVVITPSGAFANPAVTLGRLGTDTLAGINLASAPTLLTGQVIGTLVAIAVLATVGKRTTVLKSDPVEPKNQPQAEISRETSLPSWGGNKKSGATRI